MGIKKKNEKENKIKSKVKTNINFCFFGHYYHHERKYQLFLYPKPELTTTLSVSLIQETKNSQNYKDRRKLFL